MAAEKRSASLWGRGYGLWIALWKGSRCALIAGIGSLLVAQQTPSWVWAKGSGSAHMDWTQAIALDRNGNLYAGGAFMGPTITFGSITLQNHPISDTLLGSGDVFLVKYNAAGVVWAKSFGSMGHEELMALAVDENGNVYATGFFGDSLTVGSTTLHGRGDPDVFVVKYDAHGNPVWAKSLGGGASEQPNAIAIDNAGNIYVAGYFYSPTLIIDTVSLTNTGQADIFLVKYDSSGRLLWARHAVGPTYDEIADVAVDNEGNIYLTGFFKSATFTLDSITLSNTGGRDIFIAKLTPNGQVVWARSVAGTGNDLGRCIALDRHSGLYVGGEFESSVLYFPTDTLQKTPGGAMTSDIFIAKYDTSGNFFWAKGFGGSARDEVKDIGLDTSGNIYFTGRFNSAVIAFDTILLHSTGPDSIANRSDIYVAKLDSQGGVRWAVKAGVDDSDGGECIAVEAGGDVYVGGWYGMGNLVLGNMVLSNQGWYDMFVAKLSTTAADLEGRMGPEEKMWAYPNPTTGRVWINKGVEGARIAVYISSGMQVEVPIRQKASATEIDLSALCPGMYIIILRTADQIYTTRIVRLP